MARQTEPVFMQCTYDDLTFYKRGGKYYMRNKSSLTRQRVKTAPEFKGTRQHNSLLVTASKIASTIYSQLPKNWRQFWMYQSFTGEAMQKIGEGLTPKQTEQHLYNTYIAYWITWQEQTGITLETGHKPYKKASKTYKTRLKHFTESRHRKRANNSNGRWKTNRTTQTTRKNKTSPPRDLKRIRKKYLRQSILNQYTIALKRKPSNSIRSLEPRTSWPIDQTGQRLLAIGSTG